MDDIKQSKMVNVLNKLAKWRMVYASWQLGTRIKGDPECDAVRDHREGSIMLRAEVTALVMLLVKKGIITEDEWADAVTEEAVELDLMYEKFFPGFKTTQVGVTMDIAVAKQTMKDWRP